jgi:hypothetical protein
MKRHEFLKPIGLATLAAPFSRLLERVGPTLS